MEVVHPRCAGLDVHKETAVVCVRIAQGGGRARTETRTFATTTKALLGLSEWLDAEGVTHAVMESTGVYWKPVWRILQADRTLVLGNAAQLRNVPGRKSDVSDAAWLADLLAHGLVRGSFVPPEPVAELRDLTRTRKQFVRERTRATQRIQKVLEDANLKLDTVLSDVMGASGRSMVEAIIGGTSDPEALAARALGRVRAGREELVEASRGRITAHHRFMLRVHLDAHDAAESRIAALDGAIEAHLLPFRDAVERLTEMPGLGTVSAAAILGEIGPSMEVFPTAGHLVSWAGLCPRMDESAGKSRRTRLRKGDPMLKTTMVQCANAAIKARKSYFQAQYQRIMPRRGHNKAVIAVAASMLATIHTMLREGTRYTDLGRDYFDRRDEAKVVRRLAHRIRSLGYQVDVTKVA